MWKMAPSIIIEKIDAVILVRTPVIRKIPPINSARAIGSRISGGRPAVSTSQLTQQAIKAYEVQNKVLMDTAEASKQAFNAFNENTKSFASLNRNMMGYMMSALQQKSET